jgi:hypothetical protein
VKLDRRSLSFARSPTSTGSTNLKSIVTDPYISLYGLDVNYNTNPASDDLTPPHWFGSPGSWSVRYRTIDLTDPRAHSASYEFSNAIHNESGFPGQRLDAAAKFI